ncbi:MAG: hypothetical protein Q8O67_11660 [Deltaproteobacteria bacterium]|nr:hypothetical protein [Deltaproteobacteria bacterium]
MKVAAPKIAASVSEVKTSSTAARVLSRQKLFYEAGADASRDRPAHVRAGSGCAIVDVPGQGKRLAVVQDDANFIALVDTKTGKVGHIELPAGPGGLRQFDKLRGNKADKLDLESMASVVVDGKAALFCMGSGSTARREVFVLVTLGHEGPVVEELPAGSFFKGLHNNHMFAGDELNVEGLIVDGDRARFFNRGNGAGEASDAVGEVSFSALLRHLRDPLLHAAPPLGKVQDFDLGAIGGIRLTFTDATRHPDGRTVFLAAAEDSPNTYDDGEVKGTAVGILGDDGRTTIIPLLDERGAPLKDKVEGIAIDPNDPRRAFVVIDKDDPTAPAELLVVQLP